MFHPPNRKIDLNIDFFPDICMYGILSSYWLPAYWFFQKIYRRDFKGVVAVATLFIYFVFYSHTFINTFVQYTHPSPLTEASLRRD